ncbi:transcription factor HES-1 [Caerostris extrusa]|uniref:Transcription factor HES-1 n=1 Tax=Caerostris extrusa TaxID=172846 RepID=A0AAV4XGH6_CAEEX|nr:transcription factor HES-1 [Caerostris extrusa]
MSGGGSLGVEQCSFLVRKDRDPRCAHSHETVVWTVGKASDCRSHTSQAVCLVDPTTHINRCATFSRAFSSTPPPSLPSTPPPYRLQALVDYVRMCGGGRGIPLVESAHNLTRCFLRCVGSSAAKRYFLFYCNFTSVPPPLFFSVLAPSPFSLQQIFDKDTSEFGTVLILISERVVDFAVTERIITILFLLTGVCATMPAERPVSKASENRRATKPIMEKRRRARINQCLSELKTLILDALNKDPSRHSKLEKADILEMTVRHLQNIQRQQMAAAISTDSSVLNKFKAGFNECATEVSRYISRIEGIDPAMRQRLLSHLSNCLSSMNTASPFQQQAQANNLTFGGNFPGMLQSLSVQIPAGISTVGIVPATRPSTGDINNNTSHKHLPVARSSLDSQLSQVDPDRNSQSSWPPTSPSSKRSASPDAMSEDNVVLSPTCSDAGSDVFIEPYHLPKHQQHLKEMVLSPVPHRAPLVKERHTAHMQRHHHVPEAENVWRPW